MAGVYQPKIREELIPRLYRMAKARRVPMTHLVSEIVEAALETFERGAEAVTDPPVHYQSSPNPKRKGRKRT